MGWLQGLSEEVGKWIPNEVSKLNSYSKYLDMIPYIGPFLSAGAKGLSGVDAGATAYGDTGDAGLGLSSLMSGVMGRSQDPTIYGSGYMRTGVPSNSAGTLNTIGQIGNYLPGVSIGDGGGMSMDWGSSLGGLFGNSGGSPQVASPVPPRANIARGGSIGGQRYNYPFSLNDLVGFGQTRVIQPIY